MPPRLGVFVPLGEPEVDDVDDMLLLAGSNQVVIRFDVSVKESILVDILHSLQLYSKNEIINLVWEILSKAKFAWVPTI